MLYTTGQSFYPYPSQEFYNINGKKETTIRKFGYGTSQYQPQNTDFFQKNLGVVSLGILMDAIDD